MNAAHYVSAVYRGNGDELFSMNPPSVFSWHRDAERYVREELTPAEQSVVQIRRSFIRLSVTQPVCDGFVGDAKVFGMPLDQCSCCGHVASEHNRKDEGT